MSDLRPRLLARCRSLAVAAMIKSSPGCTHSAMMAAVGLKARASDDLADALADLSANSAEAAAVRRRILVQHSPLHTLCTAASAPRGTVRDFPS